MIFRNYQKTFATIGIIAIMIPVFLLAKPQKANALVPVIDAAAIAAIEVAQVAQELSDWELFGPSAVPMTAGDNLRQLRLKDVGTIPGTPTSYDSIATILAKILLRSLTDSIVQWIRSGFEGNPLFITDMEGFLTDAADQATGRFMKEFLSPEVYNLLCTPFRSQLTIALKSYRRPYGKRMQCTLSTVLANAQNAAEFGQKLREGDWGDWINVTTNPQNNPLGAVILSIGELEIRIGAEKENARTESIFNQGFLSQKKCVETVCEIRGTNYETGEEYCISEKCIKYKTASPGKWISDQLSTATGIDFQSLALADELNEVVAELINALVKQLLTGILR